MNYFNRSVRVGSDTVRTNPHRMVSRHPNMER